jgi:hypothetical protein
MLQRRQHASEDLEPQVVLIAQAVGAALDHPDLIVEPLDEAERDLVLGPAVGRDAIPMAVDHGGELLVRCQPLPLQARAPILEETPCPAFALVAPQLAEALLQHVGCGWRIANFAAITPAQWKLAVSLEECQKQTN